MEPDEIRSFRERLKMSQVEFGRELGIDNAEVSRLETGERTARGPLLKLLIRMKSDHLSRK